MGELEEKDVGKNQDPLIGYIVQLFEDLIMCDTKTNEIVPTWRNFRSGIDEVSKWMAKFLILERVLKDWDRLESWVGDGGDFGHIIYTANKARSLQI